MPKVYHVKKCRKSPGSCGKCGTKIEVGQPYLNWAFRFGGTHIRCMKPECKPMPWDLTQSDFWGQIYQLQARDFSGCESTEDFESERDDIISELESISSECQDKLSNMPDGLQQGSTGEMLQERADACDECANELGSVDCDIEELEKDEGETDEAFEARKKEQIESRLQEIREEMESALSNISCS